MREEWKSTDSEDNKNMFYTPLVLEERIQVSKGKQDFRFSLRYGLRNMYRSLKRYLHNTFFVDYSIAPETALKYSYAFVVENGKPKFVSLKDKEYERSCYGILSSVIK